MKKSYFIIYPFLSLAFFSSLSFAMKHVEYDIDCAKQKFSDPSLEREKVHISLYTSDEPQSNKASILFLHGGPGIKNIGQFDEFFMALVAQGYAVFVPEIIGSSYYEETNQHDANEFIQNYRSDIQAVVDHMREKEFEKFYAIVHSLGCHQFFKFLAHPESRFNFEAITALAGPWDLGANRLFALTQGHKIPYADHMDMSMKYGLMRSLVGAYAILDEAKGQKVLTESYNPCMNAELNEEFSVLYAIKGLAKGVLPPVQLMHAQDDLQVAFSLSLAMFKELVQNGHNAQADFMTRGEHGFIKNPTNGSDDNFAVERNLAANNILQFFAHPDKFSGRVRMDGVLTPIEQISAGVDAIKKIKKMRKSLSQQ